jgi:hypothetical protein
MVSLPELGAILCIALIIVVLVVFFFIWLVFKFVIYFLPSIIVAVLVYLVTKDLGLTAAAFIVSAIIFAIWGYNRKRSYQYPR